MRPLCVCLLHNTFLASVMCHGDAVSVLIAGFTFLHDIIDCYHPTSLETPRYWLLIAHIRRKDWVDCCMCIIHFNSVILFLDFVRIGLVVKWLLVADELVPSFSAVTNLYEVAFGLVCGRNESRRKDTSSTGMIGADFDCCRRILFTNNNWKITLEPYNSGG